MPLEKVLVAVLVCRKEPPVRVKPFSDARPAVPLARNPANEVEVAAVRLMLMRSKAPVPLTERSV